MYGLMFFGHTGTHKTKGGHRGACRSSSQQDENNLELSRRRTRHRERDKERAGDKLRQTCRSESSKDRHGLRGKERGSSTSFGAVCATSLHPYVYVSVRGSIDHDEEKSGDLQDLWEGDGDTRLSECRVRVQTSLDNRKAGTLARWQEAIMVVNDCCKVMCRVLLEHLSHVTNHGVHGKIPPASESRRGAPGGRMRTGSTVGRAFGGDSAPRHLCRDDPGIGSQQFFGFSHMFVLLICLFP
jgi:hypothetical protein